MKLVGRKVSFCRHRRPNSSLESWHSIVPCVRSRANSRRPLRIRSSRPCLIRPRLIRLDFETWEQTNILSERDNVRCGEREIIPILCIAWWLVATDHGSLRLLSVRRRDGRCAEIQRFPSRLQSPVTLPFVTGDTGFDVISLANVEQTKPVGPREGVYTIYTRKRSYACRRHRPIAAKL